MQFFTTLTFLAAALAAPLSKRDTSFGLISIHSGDLNVHLQTIKEVDSHAQVFSVGGTEGTAVTFTLKDDTTLVDQNSRGIYVNPSSGEIGLVDQWGTQAATTGFAVNTTLTLNDSDAFVACPSGDNKYSLTFNSTCEGGVGIALMEVTTSN